MPRTEQASPKFEGVLPTINPDDYIILNPDSHLGPTERHTLITNREVLLEKYITLLSELITNLTSPDIDGNVADTLVFLDKSARPLAWMLRNFWEHLAPQIRNSSTGELEVVPIPEMKFANVDRDTWRKDKSESAKYLRVEGDNQLPITSTQIKGLRSVFAKPRSKLDENYLDKRNIVIIDEQNDTGATLRIAEHLFSEAFPTSNVRVTEWIKHPEDKEVKEELPMWYPVSDPEDERGRGVYNPVTFDPSNPAHNIRFPAESYQFLSTEPLTKSISSQDSDIQDEKSLPGVGNISEVFKTRMDHKSIQLRKEIGQLVIDFLSGKLHPSGSSLVLRETIKGLPVADYYKTSGPISRERSRIHVPHPAAKIKK